MPTGADIDVIMAANHLSPEPPEEVFTTSETGMCCAICQKENVPLRTDPQGTFLVCQECYEAKCVQ